MKRTVTRWVSDKWDFESVGVGYCQLGFHRAIEMTYDDGLPEPAQERCPCALADNANCCGSSGPHGICCPCHRQDDRGDRPPCLSDFHTPAPATKDRVVEGISREYHSSDDGSRVFCPRAKPPDDADNWTASTLIIHEPVKEPTLYEVMDAINNQGVLEGSISQWDLDDLIAAYRREKAAKKP